MYEIKFLRWWIRTAYLWHCKRPLYQLSHNRCPFAIPNLFMKSAPALTCTSSIMSSTMIAIRPPTSPTTLIGGFSFAVNGGNVDPIDVTRFWNDGGGEARPSSSSSSSWTMRSSYLQKVSDGLEGPMQRTLTYFVRTSRYHCSADLLFDWFGFDQTCKSLSNSA